MNKALALFLITTAYYFVLVAIMINFHDSFYEELFFWSCLFNLGFLFFMYVRFQDIRKSQFIALYIYQLFIFFTFLFLVMMSGLNNLNLG